MEALVGAPAAFRGLGVHLPRGRMSDGLQAAAIPGLITQSNNLPNGNLSRRFTESPSGALLRLDLNKRC